MPDLTRYANYVNHPRYGRGPRFTPVSREDIDQAIEQAQGMISDRWLYEPGYVDGTFVLADWRRQAPAVFRTAAYADVECRCDACGRGFIWFAEEQKHWFEELKFNLSATCPHCVDCRKVLQREKALAETYARGAADLDRAATPDELFAGAAAGVRLIERGAFGPKAHQQVRAALNRLSAAPEFAPAVDRLRERLDAAAAEGAESAAA